MDEREPPESSVLRGYLDRLNVAPSVRVRGRVKEVTGLVVRASVPDASVGDLVNIRLRSGEIMPAEVVGFQGELVV
ncbi:MAG: EscN/YscN/HrcN family type III secretion system ATPase, partial [Bradymonadaceae bacterium]